MMQHEQDMMTKLKNQAMGSSHQQVGNQGSLFLARAVPESCLNNTFVCNFL